MWNWSEKHIPLKWHYVLPSKSAIAVPTAAPLPASGCHCHTITTHLWIILLQCHIQVRSWVIFVGLSCIFCIFFSFTTVNLKDLCLLLLFVFGPFKHGTQNWMYIEEKMHYPHYLKKKKFKTFQERSQAPSLEPWGPCCTHKKASHMEQVLPWTFPSGPWMGSFSLVQNSWPFLRDLRYSLHNS